MRIKAKVSFKEYLKLLYSLTYRKPMMIVIVCVGFAMLVWIAGYHFLNLPKPSFYQYTTLSIITIVQPLVIFSTIWKNYHSSNHLKEPQEIDFTPKEIKIKGESFYTELTWAKTYKVVELEHWFLIYQNNLSATLIPKKAMSPSQIAKFKELLMSINRLTLHLKKDD